MAEYQVRSSEMLVMFRGLDSGTQDTTQDTTQDATQDATHDTTHDDVEAKILKYCAVPRTKKEIAMTIPDKPNNKHQKYVAMEIKGL